MRPKGIAIAGALVLALGMTACVTPAAEDRTAAAPVMPSPATAGPSGTAPGRPNRPVVGTVVRFTAGPRSVDVTIGEDNPATRDLLSQLPLSLKVEEFNGREKIAYLPRPLTHDGSPGSDPEDGDLIYFTPWGNLGFYYDTDGVGYSDQTIHLGTYRATRDELAALEGQDVTVDVVARHS